MKNPREYWKGNVLEIKTDPKYLKKLKSILEIRVLDLEGNLIMTFRRKIE